MERPLMIKDQDIAIEPRRGAHQEDEAYLKLVGERVRLERVRRGLSRKALAEASGVSERYLAELERGTGNASLLILRGIASAMQLGVADLVSEEADRSIDLSLAIGQLERLEPAEIGEARRALADRFGHRRAVMARRIALIGLRGAGKSTVGAGVAKALGVPFVELDREIERASGLALSQVLAVHGSAVYRTLEHDALEAAIGSYNRAVIAAGGGIVTAPETFDMLLASCRVIWLKASPEQHVNRAMNAGHLRATARSRRVLDELRLVLDSRAPLYARAHDVIETSAKSEADVVVAVLSLVHAAK